ncbi:MAG: DUF1501 domain-containing protein, partial [Planctomycetaceae bacterium]|nr:DUF1501 domain-containing protein [Planctomycetaceae bacterium]
MGALNLLGMSSSRLLQAQATALSEATATSSVNRSRSPAKACILLFMWGGPAHQDTWDLKPDAPAEVRGEFQPIDTNIAGIQICEHFPLLSQRMHHLALIRSMT